MDVIYPEGIIIVNTLRVYFLIVAIKPAVASVKMKFRRIMGFWTSYPENHGKNFGRL